jgi:hypothetical protein
MDDVVYEVKLKPVGYASQSSTGTTGRTKVGDLFHFSVSFIVLFHPSETKVETEERRRLASFAVYPTASRCVTASANASIK